MDPQWLRHLLGGEDSGYLVLKDLQNVNSQELQ